METETFIFIVIIAIPLLGFVFFLILRNWEEIKMMGANRSGATQKISSSRKKQKGQ